jgi:hypothetical protein
VSDEIDVDLIDLTRVKSPTLRRLIEEVRREREEGRPPTGYNRTYNRMFPTVPGGYNRVYSRHNR